MEIKKSVLSLLSFIFIVGVILTGCQQIDASVNGDNLLGMAENDDAEDTQESDLTVGSSSLPDPPKDMTTEESTNYKPDKNKDLGWPIPDDKHGTIIFCPNNDVTATGYAPYNFEPFILMSSEPHTYVFGGNWLTDTDYDIDYNDAARSVQLHNVPAGTTIRVTDAPDGDKTDDYTDIYVKKSGCLIKVNSFEDSYENDHIKVAYHEHNGLDGKISYVKVWN